MIKLHATHLMRHGEVALWCDGAIVWTGALGTQMSGVTFDTVCLHVEDSSAMAARLSRLATAEEDLAALAGWWGKRCRAELETVLPKALELRLHFSSIISSSRCQTRSKRRP
jgi:hypothetical protein